MNWRDPFGKKRIRELEKENIKLREDYDNLREFYNEQTRQFCVRKELNVRNYTVKKHIDDRFSNLEPDQVDDYVKNELSIMLCNELKKELSYSWEWDEATGCRICVVSIEVLGGEK